jgi:hypothetical protein
MSADPSPSDAESLAPDGPPDLPARGWVRTAGACVVLCAALATFALTSNFHYPLREWLVFMLARYALFSILFAAACLSTGLRLTTAILPEPPRLGERLTFAFALGVLVFALGVFLGGLAGLFGRIFFFALPALMIAAGARPAWRELRRIRRHLGGFGARLFLPHGFVEGAAGILLMVSLLAVYLQVMTPLNVGGDSYWYHLPIAEQYVARGAIRPFAEGWYLGAYPQLATLLYTWAFQSPGTLFDHVALSSHLEWVLFLATLVGVSTLARRLLGGLRVPYAAAVVFLFPGIFLYDSSLITGADHVHAFFAPALGLALIRLGRRFEPREALLAGILTAGPILTKYQGIYFFVPTALFVSYLAIRTRRVRPALLWGLACLAVSSSHWLKNWIFYGDPLYPLLHKYLAARPFHEGAGPLLDREYWNARFVLTGTFWQRVLQTLAAIPTFSFIPHNWGFHGDRPVFGSLFTLLIPVLAFFRARQRLWLMIAGIHLAIVVWFVTSHQDRFLQALLPWMAACTAAMLVLAWRGGRLVRCGVATLVIFQILWGGDVLFLRSHSMIGDSPFKNLIDYVALGHSGKFEDRRRLHGGSLQSVGERLPQHAKVLIHERHDRLGMMAETVSDTVGWQGAVDYTLLETPNDTVDLWRKLGTTHVMWWPDRGGMSPEELAREAGFARAIDQWGDGPEDIGDKRLGKLMANPKNSTLAAQPTRIAWLGCGGDPHLGIFTPKGLAARKPEGRLSEEPVHAAPLGELTAANALVLRPSCGYLSGVESEISKQFKLMIKGGDVSLWVRQ